MTTRTQFFYCNRTSFIKGVAVIVSGQAKLLSLLLKRSCKKKAQIFSTIYKQQRQPLFLIDDRKESFTRSLFIYT